MLFPVLDVTDYVTNHCCDDVVENGKEQKEYLAAHREIAALREGILGSEQIQQNAEGCQGTEVVSDTVKKLEKFRR